MINTKGNKIMNNTIKISNTINTEKEFIWNDNKKYYERAVLPDKDAAAYTPGYGKATVAASAEEYVEILHYLHTRIDNLAEENKILTTKVKDHYKDE